MVASSALNKSGPAALERSGPGTEEVTSMQDERTYAERLADLSDDEFMHETFEQIDRANQSAVYSEADARARQCYEEAERRGRMDLYRRAFRAAYETAKGSVRLGNAYRLLEAGA